MTDPILPDNRPEIIGSTGSISVRRINKEINFSNTIRTVEWTSIENTTGNYWKITYTGNNFGGAGLGASGYTIYFSDGARFTVTDVWYNGSPASLVLGFTASAGWTPPSPLYAGVGVAGPQTSTFSMNNSTVRTLLGRPSGAISFSDARGKSMLGLPWLMTNRSGSSTPQNRAVVVNVAGNVYMTGWDNLTGLGYYSYVYKYSAAGELIWARRLVETGATTAYNNAQSLAIDSQGNIYVGGLANISPTSLIFRGYVLKVNPTDGTLIWRKTWNDLVGYNYYINIDSSDNIYIGGSASDGSSQQSGMIKLNSSGVQQWGRYTGTGSSEEGYNSVVDSSGNVYQMTSDLGRTSPNIIKYNSAGTFQWTRSYYDSSSGSNYGVDIAIDSSDNVYGISRIRDAWSGIVKYDSAGTVQWQRELSYTGGVDSWITPTKIVSSENKTSIYAIGYGNDSVLGRFYGSIVKLNTSGSLIWARRLDAPDGITLISATERGGFLYVVGYRSGSPSVGVTLKVPADGTLTRTFGVYTYSSFSGLSVSTVSYSLDTYGSPTTTSNTYTEIDNLESLTSESPTISRVSI